MYLLFITAGLVTAYYFLQALFTYLFEDRVRVSKKRFWQSIGLIIILSFISYAISFSVTDPALSNRLLHGLGGGSLVFITCYLAAKNSQVKIKLGQFIIISLLIVTTFGVGNEIVEFILQEFFNQIAARAINDTWLDLVSNTVGAIVTALVLIPFYRHLNRQE